MKKIVIMLWLFFILAGTGFCENQKTFLGTSPYFNYTIEYPQNWQATDMYGFAVIAAPEQNKEKVLVTVADLSKKPMSLEEFANVWLKITSLEMQNFQIIDKGETTIGDKKALFYIYTGEKEGIKLKCKRYTFSEKTNIYELTYEARDEHFDKYFNDAENIIKSIKY
ncbi:MAG: PsbP-related protein [Candidatus Omnitrophota bacterium]|nr:hypothetical protein [Candidatus Omnitrophota bacterium]